MAIQKRATGKAGIQVPKKTGFKVEDHQLTEAQTFPRSKKLKNEGVKIDLTLEQEIEYMKCALDSIYFAKNYYKITSIDEGFILFEPFDYQEDLLKAFEEHRFVIDMQCRQSGKTTVVGAFLLWFLIFHSHKEVFVLANKEKQAIEILTRVRKALLDMPFFLSPGVVKYGSTEVEFDNGSKIVAYATSSDSIRGRSASVLYIDEVAFIENDMDFWESTYPAVSQSKESRVIMTSTPKGQRGLFYKTWMEAEEDESGVSNGFFRIEVKWHDVPSYANDPTWHQKTVKRLGEARFKQEYECSFRGSVGTLISPSTIEEMVSTNPKLEPDDWTKVYHQYDPSRKYVAVADVGGGTGGDYSVCRIMDVSSYPYKTAALYRNNEISPMLFPHIIVSMCEQYGSCWVLPEINNDMGGQAITVLYYDLEYENVIKTGSDKQKGTGTKVGGKASRPGIKTNMRTRAVGCSNMKSMIESGFIKVDDLETIYELGNFISVNDRYEADSGCHDDCVMTLVIFAWLTKQDWFLDEFGRNISTDMYQKAVKEDTIKLPQCGGVLKATQPIEEKTLSGSNVKVVMGSTEQDFSAWAST